MGLFSFLSGSTKKKKPADAQKERDEITGAPAAPTTAGELKFIIILKLFYLSVFLFIISYTQHIKNMLCNIIRISIIIRILNFINLKIATLYYIHRLRRHTHTHTLHKKTATRQAVHRVQPLLQARQNQRRGDRSPALVRMVSTFYYLRKLTVY